MAQTGESVITGPQISGGPLYSERVKITIIQLRKQGKDDIPLYFLYVSTNQLD